MKHLLFISIALAMSTFSAKAQTGFDSSRLSGEGRKAYQTLLAAAEFTIGPAGYAGYSKEETALRTLLKENAGEEACANLVTDANHEGGLYGLLGLRFIKSDMFARHLQRYQLRPLPLERILAGVRVPQGKIVTMQRCFIFRVELTELLSQLEAGVFDNEFELDGKPLPILDGKPLPITAMPNKALQPWGAPVVVNSATTDVPFSFEKGLVVVKATINKDLLVEVVIATGAQYSIVDSELLKRYKVPLNSRGAEGPPIIITDPYSPISIRDFISVPNVSVGPAKTSSLSMGVGSTVQLTKTTGREIFGILGADFLKGRVVQVDFKNRVLRFIDHSPAELPRDKNESGVPTRRIILPMEESDDPLKLNLPSPVVVSATFNGKTARTLLNTGMVTVIALSSSAAKRLGFTVLTEKSLPGSYRIASLRLGTYELKDVPVVVAAKGTTIDQTLEQYGAAAGSLFLQNFIVTFDFRRKVVILEHV